MHRILLTLITDDIDALCRKFERIETYRSRDPLIAETIPGYHLEGPYMSPEPGFHGAHPPDKMKAPDPREFERLQEAAGGNIRLITLAPEWPDSETFIDAVVRGGVVVSLGHTDADEAAIDRAISAGATMCTHLGNGCPGVMPRHDNVIQRLLARDELIACLIPDGQHLPPGVIKTMFRAKPAGKVILTTDCMAAAAAPSGRYTIGHLEIEVGEDRIVRQPGTGNFAGSSLTLDEGVVNFANWTGLPLDEVWPLASTTVAECFNITLPTLEPETVFPYTT